MGEEKLCEERVFGIGGIHTGLYFFTITGIADALSAVYCNHRSHIWNVIPLHADMFNCESVLRFLNSMSDAKESEGHGELL